MQFHTCGSAALAVLSMFAGSAQAVTIYGVDQSKTSTSLQLSAGDRKLDRLSFIGSSTVFTDADLTRFNDGVLTTKKGTWGWDDEISRDKRKGSSLWVNPDRADVSSPFTGETSQRSSGTLHEVFGSDTMGFKNLSWIIDAEEKRTYSLDLYLSEDNRFAPDNDPTTLEFAVLERGANSDIGVQGIIGVDSAGAPILTDPILISRRQLTATGWTLNTLEVRKAQKVGGAGLSLPSEWGTLMGIRLMSNKGYKGADIVGVAMIPTPGSLALTGIAGMFAARRRRH